MSKFLSNFGIPVSTVLWSYYSESWIQQHLRYFKKSEILTRLISDQDVTTLSSGPILNFQHEKQGEACRSHVTLKNSSFIRTTYICKNTFTLVPTPDARADRIDFGYLFYEFQFPEFECTSYLFWGFVRKGVTHRLLSELRKILQNFAAN